MSKLIDAEVLIEKLQDEGADVTADYGPEYGAEFGYSLKKIREVINGLPATGNSVARWNIKTGTMTRRECSKCG